MAASDYISTL